MVIGSDAIILTSHEVRQLLQYMKAYNPSSELYREYQRAGILGIIVDLLDSLKRRDEEHA